MQGETFELVPGVAVVLASQERARAVFTDTSDPWLAELQEYELSARRGAACSLEEFVEYQASQALAWPEGTMASFAETLAEIGQQLARFPVFVRHLPRQIELVLSTGSEEAREGRKVAYCRGTSVVVVGQANVKSWRKPDKMKRLLLHELWHIFSRNCPAELLDRVFRLFGFKRIPKKRGAPYPEEIAPLRFTNPGELERDEKECGLIAATNTLTTDGMFASHYIDVASEEGCVLPLVPLVFLTPYQVDGEGHSPFDFITVVFGVLRQEEGEGGKMEVSWVTEPAQEGEEEEGIDSDMTLLVPPQLVPPDFWAQVSRNTGYILHPDEIAAENFVLAAMKSECDCPAKVEQLTLLLRE